MATGGGQAAVSFQTNVAWAAIGFGVSVRLLNASLYTMDNDQRAVLFDRFCGVLPETVSKGTHFLVPWLQKPFIFDIRTHPHLRLQLQHQGEYDEKVPPSISNEVLKSVVAQFNADQLLIEHPHVSALLR